MPETPLPRLAIVLATDCYETIRPVVLHLSRQTIRDQLEIVIVGPDPNALGRGQSELEGFARVHFVEVGGLDPVGPARAAGVRASTAPFVFIGETHTYAHPTWAESMLRAHGDSRVGVVPGFGNANPGTALSWAIFLLDYGQWLHLMPARESSVVPTHNASFARQVLLELGPALDHGLIQGDTLTVLLRGAGHTMHFEPAARIDHLNVARWSPWMQERFLGGLLLGGRRAERWPALRRLVYFCGSPVIPLLLILRLRKVLQAARREGLLPVGTLAALLVGGAISATGEMAGYVFGAALGAERKMMEFELHKVRYASRRASALS
jgi:hypothetical protein